MSTTIGGLGQCLATNVMRWRACIGRRRQRLDGILRICPSQNEHWLPMWLILLGRPMPDCTDRRSLDSVHSECYITSPIVWLAPIDRHQVVTNSPNEPLSNWTRRQSICQLFNYCIQCITVKVTMNLKSKPFLLKNSESMKVCLFPIYPVKVRLLTLEFGCLFCNNFASTNQ